MDPYERGRRDGASRAKQYAHLTGDVQPYIGRPLDITDPSEILEYDAGFIDSWILELSPTATISRPRKDAS